MLNRGHHTSSSRVKAQDRRTKKSWNSAEHPHIHPHTHTHPHTTRVAQGNNFFFPEVIYLVSWFIFALLFLSPAVRVVPASFTVRLSPVFPSATCFLVHCASRCVHVCFFFFLPPFSSLDWCIFSLVFPCKCKLTRPTPPPSPLTPHPIPQADLCTYGSHETRLPTHRRRIVYKEQSNKESQTGTKKQRRGVPERNKTEATQKTRAIAQKAQFIFFLFFFLVCVCVCPTIRASLLL